MNLELFRFFLLGLKISASTTKINNDVLMKRLMKFKPRYYKGDKVITGDHIARFYGCLLAKMLSGTANNTRMFSTRNVFDAVEPVKRCMPLDAIKDLTRCLHYTDDWEEEEDVEWETLYTDPKFEAQDGTAQHRRKKFSMERPEKKKIQRISREFNSHARAIIQP